MTLIFRLDSFSVSGDADPPIVQFNIILPAGRNTPPFSFLEHLLPQSGTSKASRGGANTSSASVDNNFNVYQPNNYNFKCHSLILLAQNDVFLFNRKIKLYDLVEVLIYLSSAIPKLINFILFSKLVYLIKQHNCNHRNIKQKLHVINIHIFYGHKFESTCIINYIL
jgi:hypothetical protein